MSTRMKPLSSSQSRIALMIVARTRRMAHCRLERSHRWRLSIRNSTPCSFGPMGYSADSWTTCRSLTSNSKPPGMPGARWSARTVPVMISDDSSGRRLAASNSLLRDVALEDDGLDDARAIADAQKLQLAFAGLELEPALEGDCLPDVAGDVFDADDVCQWSAPSGVLSDGLQWTSQIGDWDHDSRAQPPTADYSISAMPRLSSPAPPARVRSCDPPS